jgi:chemotaxis signal transduction protein
MILDTNADQKSFILFTLGKKRFALPAESVVELVGPCPIHVFRHSDPMIQGVLIRRGRIVPVWDVARLLCGATIASRRFHLIAKRQFGEATEWTAIPVSGECEIIGGLEPFPPSNEHPAWVSGLLLLVEDVVEMLDLSKLDQADPSSSAWKDSAAAAEVRA